MVRAFTFTTLLVSIVCLQSSPVTRKDVCNRCISKTYKRSNNLFNNKCCGMKNNIVLDDLAELYSLLTSAYKIETKDITRRTYKVTKWNCQNVKRKINIKWIVSAYNTIAAVTKNISQHANYAVSFNPTDIVIQGRRVMCDFKLLLIQKGAYDHAQKELSGDACWDTETKQVVIPSWEDFSLLDESFKVGLGVVGELHESLRCYVRGKSLRRKRNSNRKRRLNKCKKIRNRKHRKRKCKNHNKRKNRNKKNKKNRNKNRNNSSTRRSKKSGIKSTKE